MIFKPNGGIFDVTQTEGPALRNRLSSMGVEEVLIYFVHVGNTLSFVFEKSVLISTTFFPELQIEWREHLLIQNSDCFLENRRG
jgi:hypothetical protein